MPEPRSASGPRLPGDAARLVGPLDLRDPIGMLTVFAPQDRAASVGWERRAMRCMGTEAVCSHDAREVRRGLAPRGHRPCGGMPFTIVFLRTIAVHKRLGQKRHAGPRVRMAKRGASPLMRLGDG